MTLLERIYKAIADDPLDVQAYQDAFDCIRSENGGVVEAHGLKDVIRQNMRYAEDKPWVIESMYELNRKILCYCARDSFDDFIQYMEIDRPFEKKFYLPRRKQLKPLADALEDLEYRRLELLALSLPPGVGKSTLAEFFLTWTGGRHPELPILTGSHSNSFLRGMYGEIIRFLDPNGEYKWNDVFPELKILSTNAQDMMIDIGEFHSKRFATYEFSSVYSGNAGKVRAANILYCDDLVSSLEEAVSRERMDKLFQTYASDLRQRKIGSCAELHIATRWSVHDVIGRLETMYEGNPKARFINTPALDANDESLFDYPIPAGLSTKFIHEQRDAMDDASFRALYMGQPVEREGQLYNEDELRKYFELPDGVPDAIISVCDTKDKGVDYCFCPIAYVYGQDYYIEDLICDNSNPEIVEERLVQKHVQHNVQTSQFESNAAGGRVAEKVQAQIKERGGRTSISTKWSSANKETKIIVNAPWVKEHCLFKETKDREYRKAMNFLCGYTMIGKNRHDDVPDGMAQLALYAQGFVSNRVEVIKRPW